jgi:hypothetical protein
MGANRTLQEMVNREGSQSADSGSRHGAGASPRTPGHEGA